MRIKWQGESDGEVTFYPKLNNFKCCIWLMYFNSSCEADAHLHFTVQTSQRSPNHSWCSCTANNPEAYKQQTPEQQDEANTERSFSSPGPQPCLTCRWKHTSACRQESFPNSHWPLPCSRTLHTSTQRRRQECEKHSRENSCTSHSTQYTSPPKH